MQPQTISPSPSRRGAGWFYGIFFLSGVSGLGYQMVWTKMFALGLGHEMPSVLAVVAAFFGGLALGAWALDKRVSSSSRPGYWYVGLELVIGVWGFLSVELIPWCNELGFGLMGVSPGPVRHWGVAFVLPFVALGPATVAMGATLPAMERFVSPMAPGGRCVGGLYAANTAGAVVGTLVSAFGLMPQLGLGNTVWVLAGVNLICAAAVVAMSPGVERNAASVEPITEQGKPNSHARLGLTVFFTGLLGIGYEALGVRVMSQVLENTVYSFAAVLSVYLMGTAVGAALYQRLGRRLAFETTLGYLIWGISMTCLLGTLMLSLTKPIYAAARTDYFGDSLYGVMACEMIVAGAVFALPTVLMGAAFSHLVQAAKRASGGVGWAAAINTLGGAVAPCVFGVLLLPAAGAKGALVTASLGYLLLIPWKAVTRWAAGPTPVVAVMALIPTFLTPYVWSRDLQVITKYANQRVIDYREGVMAAVAVLESDQGHRALRVNNRFRMGSTDGAVFECLQAQTPLLLHPNPKRALFLGLGTAITFRAAAFEPGLEADGVELVPEIIGVLKYFTPVTLPDDYRDRQKIYVADARRFVRATEEDYDVIVADLFHPGRDGAGFLYTREHFTAVRDRLAPSGLFCQWLPLYQMDEPTLRVIIATFLEVFPDGRAFLADFNIAHPALGLVGGAGSSKYPADWFQQRVRDTTLRRYLKGLLMRDGVRLFGAYVAGPEQLSRYAGDAAVNTDNNPVVTFEAPRFTSRKDATPYGRLVAILEACGPEAADLVEDPVSGPDARMTDRINRYIEARDIYVGGLVVAAQGDQEAMVDAFIESAAVSDDFAPGYAGCLAIVQERAVSDRPGAIGLLRRLIEAQPHRPEARQWLSRLKRH